MGGGTGIGEPTTKRLEIRVVTPRLLVFKGEDLGKLAEGSVLINPDGTPELIIQHIPKYSRGLDAMATLKRIPNSQPPQIKSTFYRMVNRECPYIVLFEDFCSTSEQGESDNYDNLHQILLEAEE